MKLDNGVKAWAFSTLQYIQEAVKNVEEYLERQDNKRWKLPSNANTQILAIYHPELDVSPKLNVKYASDYQSLIGVLHWMVELGRLDIWLEVSLLSSHLALTREGHFEQVLQVFSYLKKFHNTELLYDPSDPVVDEGQFQMMDSVSSKFGHVGGQEEAPERMPEQRGLGVSIRAKVDADHASNTVTRRSRTGFLVYLNCLLIYWWSKKQTESI